MIVELVHHNGFGDSSPHPLDTCRSTPHSGICVRYVQLESFTHSSFRTPFSFDDYYAYLDISSATRLGNTAKSFKALKSTEASTSHAAKWRYAPAFYFSKEPDNSYTIDANTADHATIVLDCAASKGHWQRDSASRPRSSKSERVDVKWTEESQKNGNDLMPNIKR